MLDVVWTALDDGFDVGAGDYFPVALRLAIGADGEGVSSGGECGR